MITKELPRDAPEPFGKPVITTIFLDANLWHYAITGRSVTATLHFVNTTPTEWYSKRQAPVENATYGSEFVPPDSATEKIIELRQKSRYLGCLQLSLISLFYSYCHPIRMLHFFSKIE